jgi:iron complex transport system substrate-binding protein
LRSSQWPKRIVCLTAETTEIVFALGAGDRVVGVSGYATRPPEARLKEKVSAFTSARMDKIRALQPDLVLAFSDLQKDLLRDLAGEGYNVFLTNQRSLDEIGETILAIGRLLGLEANAQKLCDDFYGELDQLEKKAQEFPRRLRVYFEEWDDPLISGIRWAGDLIRKLGGEDIFEELGGGSTASERIVQSKEVIRRNPEVILATWCGKKVRPEKICARPGWEAIEAVQKNQIYEIKSPDILQPGPSLLHGARQVFEIFRKIHKFSFPKASESRNLEALRQEK